LLGMQWIAKPRKIYATEPAEIKKVDMKTKSQYAAVKSRKEETAEIKKSREHRSEFMVAPKLSPTVRELWSPST